VIAIVAGVLGFGGVATPSAGIAQTIFYIFLVLVLVSLVYHLLEGAAFRIMCRVGANPFFLPSLFSALPACCCDPI
jgi:uncharacterized membrane protein YtjA (UPF0391 family)